MKNKTLIVTGPTATGKTSLATDLCRKFKGEIISADSRQVYKGLDIGTGKDLIDYFEPTPVPYHMIDICEPNDEFSLYDWRSNYVSYQKQIRDNGALPVICGGTPLYLDMLLSNYELKGAKRSYSNEELKAARLEELVSRLKENYPHMLSSTDTSQKARVLRAIEIAQNQEKSVESLPETEYLIIAPYWHRKVVHQRIEARLKDRWPGLLKEAKSLLEAGVSHERLEWFGLEYRFMSRYYIEELSEKESFDQLLIKIRQFAKRQDIWFRKIEKAGHVIHWLNEDDKLTEASQLLKAFLNDEELPQPKLRISEITYGPRTQ